MASSMTPRTALADLDAPGELKTPRPLGGAARATPMTDTTGVQDFRTARPSTGAMATSGTSLRSLATALETPAEPGLGDVEGGALAPGDGGRHRQLLADPLAAARMRDALKEKPEEKVDNDGKRHVYAAVSLGLLILIGILLLSGGGKSSGRDANRGTNGKDLDKDETNTTDNKVTKDEKDKKDEKDDFDHSVAPYKPLLICVSKEYFFKDDTIELLNPCGNIIYLPEINKYDRSFDLSFNVKYTLGISFISDRVTLRSHVTRLASWQGVHYAFMGILISSDFSNTAAAQSRIMDMSNMLVKRVDVTFIGFIIKRGKVQATKENGQKLASIAKNATIIFQVHDDPDTAHCLIGVHGFQLTKASYRNLTEGINNSVAISTTLAIVKFDPTDQAHTAPGAKCKSKEVLGRKNEVCESMGKHDNSGHHVFQGFVYEYATNSTAQKLFVSIEKKHISHSWKYNIAFFNLELFEPGSDGLCPKFRLGDFKRKINDP